jgi:hypothetical protein
MQKAVCDERATKPGPRCSRQMAKSKEGQSAEPQSEKTDWVKEVLGKWADAADKNDCDPLDLQEAPEWVLNAWVSG